MTDKKPQKSKNNDAFSNGYFCAVSHLLSAHGASILTDEIIRAHGHIDIKKLDQYDVVQLKENGYIKNGMLFVKGNYL